MRRVGQALAAGLFAVPVGPLVAYAWAWWDELVGGGRALTPGTASSATEVIFGAVVWVLVGLPLLATISWISVLAMRVPGRRAWTVALGAAGLATLHPLVLGRGTGFAEFGVFLFLTVTPVLLLPTGRPAWLLAPVTALAVASFVGWEHLYFRLGGDVWTAPMVVLALAAASFVVAATILVALVPARSRGQLHVGHPIATPSATGSH